MKKILALIAYSFLTSTALGQNYPYSPGAPSAPNPNISNVAANAQKLRHWNACVAAVIYKQSRCTLLIIGDSLASGWGCGALYNDGMGHNSPIGGANQCSFAAALANQLLQGYVPVNFNSFISDSNLNGVDGNNYGNYNYQVNPGTWGVVNQTLGGYVHVCLACGSTFSFTPIYPFDTFRVIYTNQPGYGTMTVNVDGGSSLGTINQNAVAALTSTTFTVNKGNHTINFVNTAGVSNIIGVIAYDSTVPAIDIVVASQTGGAACTIGNTYPNPVTNPCLTSPPGNVYDPLPTLQYLAPSLTIYAIGGNDINTGTNVSSPIPQFTTYTNQVVNTALMSGDFMFVTDFPANIPQVTNGIAGQYYSVYTNIAQANNLIVADNFNRWGSFAMANSLGLMYSDGFHQTGQGYEAYAHTIAEILTPGAGIIGVGNVFATSLGYNNRPSYIHSSGYTISSNATIASLSDTTSFSAGGIGTQTLLANSVSAGSKLHIHWKGTYNTPAANTATLTYKVKWGATVIASVTTGALPSSATAFPLAGDIYCTVRSVGVSGSIICNGGLTYENGLIAAPVYNDMAAGVVTINTTVNNLMDVTGAFSVLSTQSITVNQASIEYVN